MTPTADNLPFPESHKPVFQSEPPEEGLGEFAETIIDEYGELDPDVLEDPEEKND